MCMWVRAMHKYHQVSVMVEPKKKLLAEATAELEETMQKLAEAQARPRRLCGGAFPSTRRVSGNDGRSPGMMAVRTASSDRDAPRMTRSP